MVRPRIVRGILRLYVTLGLMAWGAAVATAAETYLLVIAPCPDQAQAPPLGLGLQQVLIDDFETLLPKRVMPREALRTLLAAPPGKTARPVMYLSDIPALGPQLHTRYVLACTLRVHEGTVTWQATLARGTTGAVVQTWTFSGGLERVWVLKGHVVAVVAKHLSVSPDTVPKAGQGTEATLASLGALTRGLAALDRKEYGLAVREWRQAVQSDDTFHYATRQLDKLRTVLQQAPLTPRERGLWLVEEEQYEPAEAALQAAVRANDKDGEAWRTLGQIVLNRKDTKTARLHATKARELEPGRAAAWMLLGQTAQAEGKEQEARDLMQKARDLAPTQVEPRVFLAESATKAREQDKAKQEYVQASALATTALRFPEARAYVASAKKVAPQAPEPLVGEGDLLRNLGQPQSALTAYTQAQTLAPKSALIAQKLGGVHRQLGAMQAAVTQYQQALSLTNNEDVESNVQLGRIHLDARDFTRASPYLEKARKLQPARADVHKLLGGMYSRLGKRDDAVQSYQAAIRHRADDPDTYEAYGDALSVQGKVADAAVQYTKAVQLAPDSLTAYQRLGTAQEQLGKKAEAASALERVKLLTPEVGPTALTPAGSPQVQAGIAQLLASFPVVLSPGGPAPVALLPLERLTPSPGLLSQAWQHLTTFVTWRRVDNTPIARALEAALQPTYQVLPQASIDTVLSKPPYKTMGLEHLTNVPYLSELCDALAVRGLLLYSTQSEGPILQETYEVTLRVVLFDKARKMPLTNEVRFDLTKAEMTVLNTPFVAFLLGTGVLGGGILGVYTLGGRGKLVVRIHQVEDENKAFFSVVVSKKGNKDLTKTKRNLLKVVKQSVKGGRYEREVRHGGYERSMVFNETTFPKLHVGAYHVYLFGVLTNAAGEDIGNYQRQQHILIKKQQSHEVAFDLRPQTSRTRIQVLDGQDPALGAEITIRGGESRYLREARGVLFRLPVGRYTCAVHYHDKLFTQEIEITSLGQDFRFTFTVPTGATSEAQDSGA